MIIRPFRPGDATGVSILLDTAFEGQAELRLVQALREADQIAVELVAELEGHVVGHICFARLVAPEGWLSLSPLVVSPSQQDRGIGSDLVRAGLDAARQAGAKAITVLGAPDYYTRFGFTLKAAENLHTPYDRDYFLVYPIAAGTSGHLGKVIYPSAFQGI
ncbi:putative acetyltransferase [Pseudooceanicola nitratireducens]|jgi:putative acetyltransferase|uniref:Putative acetyltransferase n=1 Tax=Pseudooceanicola nitratireducens TaxID=517719 RepID=A0A1I1JU18_9RHOB|nr:N-acetyltransferase [Pseudooceanicola nitratireducens]MBY6165112.1 N-acetyltransferase [Pseudooceanicola nitratireducens]SEJ53848.1 putative acetyltransferase [Pseudooceanicola nitratireducens]SFC49313.1 putative acetyltransferase [Pseudooceanicola nitratireducens]